MTSDREQRLSEIRSLVEHQKWCEYTGYATTQSWRHQMAWLLDQLAERDLTIERARTYSGLEGWSCPLCKYENGKFIENCEMHRQLCELEIELDATEAKLAERNRALAGVYEHVKAKMWTSYGHELYFGPIEPNTYHMQISTEPGSRDLAARFNSVVVQLAEANKLVGELAEALEWHLDASSHEYHRDRELLQRPAVREALAKVREEKP